MTRWSAITRTPPQLLRARLRLALHSRGGKNLNPVVHHERGRYSGRCSARAFTAVGSTDFTAVRGRSALWYSGRTNHRDPVTPPHLPGGNTGGDRSPDRNFQH